MKTIASSAMPKSSIADAEMNATRHENDFTSGNDNALTHHDLE